MCAGFIVTGSQDNTIIVHSMDEDSGGIYTRDLSGVCVCVCVCVCAGGGAHCLSGHKGTVSCVTYQCSHLISGS